MGDRYIIFTDLVFGARYNSMEHPIPFYKATESGKVPKKLAGGPVPDLEEAYVSFPDMSCMNALLRALRGQVDDEIDEVSEDEAKSKFSDDAIKDNLIKIPKKKGKAVAK